MDDNVGNWSLGDYLHVMKLTRCCSTIFFFFHLSVFNKTCEFRAGLQLGRGPYKYFRESHVINS